MCAAVFGVVRPVKSTITVMVLVVVSQNTIVVPVAVDSGCCGLSLSPLRPGTAGPSATNWSAALPVRSSSAVASSFLPLASSVAARAGPDAVGAYSTVTVHDLRGPRLVSLQVSSVIESSGGPVSVTVSAADADPPELVSVNVCETVFPTPTRPKPKLSFVDGDQASEGGPPACPATATTSTVTAHAASAPMIRLRLFRIAFSL